MYERAQRASVQMGTTQTQLCFICGIWARFRIIYFFSNTPQWANVLHKWDFYWFFDYFNYLTSPFGSWRQPSSIKSHGYVVTRSMTNIQNGGYLCESAVDVKYENDVKHKKLVSCVHERIANRMKLECRDGPMEDRYKTDINTTLLFSIMSTNTRWQQGEKRM